MSVSGDRSAPVATVRVAGAPVLSTVRHPRRRWGTRLPDQHRSLHTLRFFVTPVTAIAGVGIVIPVAWIVTTHVARPTPAPHAPQRSTPMRSGPGAARTAGPATSSPVLLLGAVAAWLGILITPDSTRYSERIVPKGRRFRPRRLHDGCGRELRLGARHGVVCLGSCWALMAALFAFGLMNLLAMAVLSGAVFVEKVWVRGPWFARVLGFVALALALAVVFVPGLAPGLQAPVHASGAGGVGRMPGM
jgi:hypothetical protein